MAQTSVKSTQDVVEFLKDQHNTIKTLFAEALNARENTRRKAAVVDARLADEHAARERRLKAADSIAPTHPHAGVESAAANFAVGPFPSMLDRARDAIGQAIG